MFDTLTEDNALVKMGKSTDFPPKVSYWISRILNSIASETKIYNEERMKLVNKYCDKDENGKPIELENNQVKMTENMAIFMEKFAELQDSDVDIQKNKIKLKLEQIPQGLLSAFDMTLLDPFFDIEEEIPELEKIPETGPIKN